jgi:hypothetical protein
MATLQKFINNGATTLAAGILDTDLSFDVVDASRLPAITGSEWFYLTLTQASTETSWEIVKVTAVVGNTLTVERAQQGTVAAAWAGGDKAENRITKLDVDAWSAPYRIASADDLTYIALTNTSVVWKVQGLDFLNSDGSTFTQYYGLGDTSMSTTGNYSVFTPDAKYIAFQSGDGGNISFIAGNVPGSLPTGVLSMSGLAVQFSGTSFDLIPPLSIRGEPPIEMRFYQRYSSTNYVGFSVVQGTEPASNVIWRLPNADGVAGQTWVTDGLGVLSWATPLSTPAIANALLAADGVGGFSASADATLTGNYLLVSGSGATLELDNGVTGYAGIYDDGSAYFTGAISSDSTITGSNLSGTNTGDQDLSGLQPLDAQLTALAGLSYASNGGKFIRVNGTEDGFELATVSTAITVTDDTTTNATMYPLWATAAGSTSTVYVSTTDITWNPSTNALSIALASAGSGFMFRTSSSSGALLGTNVNNQGGVTLGSTAQINWTNGNPVSGTPDVFLSRGGAGVLSNSGAYQSLQAVAATTVDGLILATSEAATLNNQKYSPALKWTGSAWVTGAVSAPIAVGMLAELVPVQAGSKWYNYNLSFKGSYDGGAYTELWRYDGALNALVIGSTKYGYASISSSDWGFNINVGACTLSFANNGSAITGLRNNLYYESYQATAAATTDGLVLATSSTATIGSAKYSPALRLRGQAMRLNSVSSSMPVDFKVEVRPVDGNSQPVARTVFSQQVNNGGYSDIFWFHGTSPEVSTLYFGATVNTIGQGGFVSSTGIWMTSGMTLAWSNNSASVGVSDLYLYRNGAANLRQGGAAANPPIAQYTSVQNASGNDIAGAIRYYDGSLATGNATSGGHAFRTGDVGASGTTLQTQSVKVFIDYLGNLQLPKTSGVGIKVDAATFPWRDITGDITVRGSGASDPSFATYTGTALRQYQFSASTEQEVFIVFHIPHDIVPGSDIFLHVHWSNAAATPNTGNVVWGFDYAFAKGFNQEAFPALSTITVTQACPATRYQHNIAETTGITIASLTEPDGLLLVRVYRKAADAADTCTDAVFLHTADIHYQSTGIGTKNKVNNFYS